MCDNILTLLSDSLRSAHLGPVFVMRGTACFFCLPVFTTSETLTFMLCGPKNSAMSDQCDSVSINVSIAFAAVAKSRSDNSPPNASRHCS